MNPRCSGIGEFDPFHTNHSKIGICIGDDISIIGGNNHSIDTQGERGGLFVVIKDSKLNESLSCLLNQT